MHSVELQLTSRFTQSGIGNVANSIIGGLANGPFEKVQVWTEVLQDTYVLVLFECSLSFPDLN